MGIYLETERLMLKDYCENDLEYVHILKSNPVIWGFSSNSVVKSEKESKTYLDSILKSYSDDKHNFQALFLKDTQEFIGEAGILSLNKNNKRAVLGYNLLPKYWGCGYATEITKALVKHLFEVDKAERIEALVVEGNEGSRRVLEKSGFVEEGLLRNFAYIDNKYFNVYYYGMIRDDYIGCKMF